MPDVSNRQWGRGGPRKGSCGDVRLPQAPQRRPGPCPCSPRQLQHAHRVHRAVSPSQSSPAPPAVRCRRAGLLVCLVPCCVPQNRDSTWAPQVLSEEQVMKE